MIVIHSETLKGRDCLEDLDNDEKIILKLIFKKLSGRVGLDSIGSEQRQVAGSCDHGNEPLGSIKGRQFLE
jgi:hypothetical protein